MVSCRGRRRTALDGRNDVAAAGFPVGGDGTIPLVLHRSSDGRWRLVDEGGLTELAVPVRAQAISMAAAIVSGMDLCGRTVTAIDGDGDLRWSAVWRARPSYGSVHCRTRTTRRTL